MSELNVNMSVRLQQLKNAYLEAVPSITVHRALAYTDAAKAYPDAPVNVRRAKGFRLACETAPLLIQDHELIVGHPCGKPRAGAFSPDIAWEWMRDELDTIATRPQDPYFISEDDKAIMREVLFPFWEGKSLAEACEHELRAADLWEYGAEAAITDLTYHVTSGGGDSSPGYDIILFEKGIAGIKAEAEAYLSALDENADDAAEKKAFYQASIDICDGIITYANRLSAYATELAEKESNPLRKKELQTIAAINARVPAHPPETFEEALQAIWTIQSLFLLEENQCSTSLGRVDQYVYPLYQKSLENGLSEQEAFEWMGCFLIKCSEMIWYTPGATAKYFAGYMPFINMCVGGVRRDGGDGTNDLTYLIMETVRQMKVYQPTLACRIHNQSPRKYLEAIVQLVKVGGGMPACHFDDAHIRMMLRKGYSFEDARDYSLMGCVEPQKSGKIHQWTAGGFTQWPIVIELAMNRGVLKTYGEKQWLDTGDINDFATYDAFEAAVKRQLDDLIDKNCRGTQIIERVFRDVNPTPYMSLFMDGCMEAGKDVMAGGACMYGGPGTIFAGLATYVDSMAAIKKLVYDDKKYTLAEIKEAIDADWVGYERIRKDCRLAPKYGNDDNYADLIAKDIVDYTEQRMNSYPSLYAKQIHGTLSQSFNTPLGEMVGATPDGRGAHKPLSDAMSPSPGADTKGPTAIIKSVSKINVESMSLGMAHNFKFGEHFLDTPEGKNSFIALLQSASVMGNGQMQFNYVDNETLRAAQVEPEEHRDLIVRVAGYCAFFVELCEEVQDEIIGRTVLGE